MHRAAKLVSFAAVAAILAACSGTGSTSLPSTTNNNSGPTTQAVYPRSAVGTDGHVMVFLYNKQIELSGRVNNGPSGPRSPMSIITGAMTWHGGPVQTTPKIYVDFWGSSSQWSSTGDPDGVASYYTSFISGVGGSAWMSTVTQYGEPNSPYTGNQTGSYAGSWYDTANKIPRLTSGSYQSYIAAEAARAAAHFGDYSANASYVIMIPHGVSVNSFGTRYCAWHSSTTANGSTIAYTNLPYIPDAGSSCGVGSVNSPGTDDGVSIVGGHEQAETETDPQPNTGWLDSGNNEIGDKCAWVNLQNTSFSTGTFPTQPLWSNSANGCVQ
jgi:serine protease